MNRPIVSKMAVLSALLIFVFLFPVVLSAEMGTPIIEIKSPSEGAKVQAGNVTVSVQVFNFSLMDKFGQENVPGEGHIHYYMDAEAPTKPGQPAVTTAGSYAPSANAAHTWQNVAAGAHNFSVQLVNNDHTPIGPPAVRTVNVTAVATPEVVVDLVARGVAFNTKSITVPAGSKVIVNFDNQDSGIRHNFAVYDSPSAQQVIFKGDLIAGPGKITYTFLAPTQPGTYFFRCDPHPQIMKGQFIVQQI